MSKDVLVIARCLTPYKLTPFIYNLTCNHSVHRLPGPFMNRLTTTIPQPVASSPVSGTVEIVGAAGTPRRQRQRIGLLTTTFFYSTTLLDSALCIDCIDNTIQDTYNGPLMKAHGRQKHDPHHKCLAPNDLPNIS